MINVSKRELSLQVENKKVTFNVFQVLKDPPVFESCCQRNTMDKSAIKKNLMKATKHPSDQQNQTKSKTKL